MSVARLGSVLAMCAAGTAGADILGVRGSFGATLGLSTTGLPDPSTDSLAFGRPVDVVVEDSRFIDFFGADFDEQVSVLGSTDFEGTRGHGQLDVSTSLSRSLFSLTAIGSGSVVTDGDDSQQNTNIIAGLGGFIELQATPGTELEISIDTSLGVRSHPTLGQYWVSVEVEGLEGLDPVEIRVNDDSHTPIASSITLIGFADENGYLFIDLGNAFSMYSRGTEVGGLPATIDGIGSSISVRVVPAQGTVVFAGMIMAVNLRRRR